MGVGRAASADSEQLSVTISERIAANLKEAMEQGNNILGFLKSEGYFEIRQGAKCKSTDFYKVYERWCLDNLEKPLAASTFIHHLKDNQKSLGMSMMISASAQTGVFTMWILPCFSRWMFQAHGIKK